MIRALSFPSRKIHLANLTQLLFTLRSLDDDVQKRVHLKKIPFRSFLLSWKGPSPIRIQCLEVIDKTCPALFSFFFNPWRISSGDKNLKIKLTLDFCYSSTIVGTFVHRFPLFFWVDKCYTMCGFYNYPRATAVTNFLYISKWKVTLIFQGPCTCFAATINNHTTM